jgi:hypothetical protein
MPNTTNFNWPTPADTDLVKDGAAAIRNLGDGVDTSLVDLKGGTTGQILSKASDTDMDFAFITPNVGDLTEVQAGTGISVADGTGPIPIVTNTVATEFDALGDLVVGTGSDTFDRLAVGTNDYVLTAASGEITGLKWAAPSSPSFVGCNALRNNVSTAMTEGVAFKPALTTEEFDTNAFHDNSTNNTRVTIPSGKGGYYIVNGYALNALGTVGYYQVLYLLKNNAGFTGGGFREAYYARYSGSETNQPLTFSSVLFLSAGDYLELQYLQQVTETVSMWFGLQVAYLGA